ncbi:transmembrane and ubiquitin-like domain-containing protein 1 [Tamandua tetradactyla]|uniref:transmembrane and ubiquitin-like domain-containing protein 1 n=1 Tax=Tamandua tetradactyla TaxID=48850 RepID=UPI0040539AAD
MLWATAARKEREPSGNCDLGASRPEVSEGPIWSWRSGALGSAASKSGAMALIEGVGDEVTILFAVLACLLVLALAWVSTHTTEGPDPLPQSPGTPTPAQHSETMAVINNIRGEAPGAEVPSLRHRGQAAQPEPGPGLPATPLPPDSSQEPLVLRLKFLNDSEQVARAWPHDTIGSLKRTQFPGREQQVRLIYQGQLLGDDTQTLGSLHLPPNCVLHCHVSTRVGPPHPPCPPGSEPGPSGLEIGSLLLPLLLLMLLLLWYCQIQYRPFFPLTATLGLAGFTLLLSLLAFAMYHP